MPPRWVAFAAIGEAGVEELLKATIDTAVATQAVRPAEFERIIVDSTVQVKAIAPPVDSRLLEITRAKLVQAAKFAGISLKQTFVKEGRELRRKAGGYAHAKQFKQRRWLKRRQAVEPAIGHLQSDNRMDRCRLAGQLDALHAVLCAAGYNLRWLLRAMVRLGLKALLLRLLFVALLTALLRANPLKQARPPAGLSLGGAGGFGFGLG